VGHVFWQGRPPQPHALQQLPITLTIKSGTTEVNYPATTTDSRGVFTVTANLADGQYNWRVKNPKYLANGGSLTLVRGTVIQVEMGTMRAGDCNNDNLISSQDFIILKNSYGKQVGDPGYDDRANFNGDTVVNTQDFSAMRINFGQGGVPPLLPIGEEGP
jgi:dockerin type I repeat protein